MRLQHKSNMSLYFILLVLLNVCLHSSSSLPPFQNVIFNESLTVFFPFLPIDVTLSSMLHQQRSAQSPSLSLLVQEAIVSSVVLEHSIRRGTFSERYVGRWRRENVNVRVYPELHEQLFYSESHLYQVKGHQLKILVCFKLM